MCNSISIHALREESDQEKLRASLDGAIISIHALREESDQFNRARGVHQVISIHALREESDLIGVTLRQYQRYISIHALREESDSVASSAKSFALTKFQSTLSVRRATLYYFSKIFVFLDFNPRSP